MPPPVIPSNKYSLWATREQNRNDQYKNAFNYAEDALIHYGDVTGIPIENYGDNSGAPEFYYNRDTQQLLFANQRYNDLEWVNKALSYSKLDAFFKAIIYNYHRTNNI
jgi:hypothetical protein